jgi:AraC-like DNA-binding protein
MAALCCVSLRQMERFFDSQCGLTPGRWLRELRCYFAAQLISKGWANKAVALELGFSNAAHLCHEFKRIYGLAPQSFAPCPEKGGTVVNGLPPCSNRAPALSGVTPLSQAQSGRSCNGANAAHLAAPMNRTAAPGAGRMQFFENA